MRKYNLEVTKEKQNDFFDDPYLMIKSFLFYITKL